MLHRYIYHLPPYLIIMNILQFEENSSEWYHLHSLHIRFSIEKWTTYSLQTTNTMILQWHDTMLKANQGILITLALFSNYSFFIYEIVDRNFFYSL